MSDNKYIIDKDSLTGIADAVRDKLGIGETTTDSQTGDIIYPEDKGYYLKETIIAKINGFGWSKTGYSGSFNQQNSPKISSADWEEDVGEPWYSAEITLTNVSGRSYYMRVYYTDGYEEFTSVTSSTYTVSVPSGSTYFSLSFGNAYSSSVYSGQSSLGSITVVFKDAKGKPIQPKQSSFHYTWVSHTQGTANFGSGDIETPIPFSIDDIQDKITNYLVFSINTVKFDSFQVGYLSNNAGNYGQDLSSYISSMDDIIALNIEYSDGWGYMIAQGVSQSTTDSTYGGGAGLSSYCHSIKNSNSNFRKWMASSQEFYLKNGRLLVKNGGSTSAGTWKSGNNVNAILVYKT